MKARTTSDDAKSRPSGEESKGMMSQNNANARTSNAINHVPEIFTRKLQIQIL